MTIQETIASAVVDTLSSIAGRALIDSEGMPAIEFEPCVYVRDVRSVRGGMMGSVVIDCVNIDAQHVACVLRDSWADLDLDDEREFAIEPETFGQRVIVHECSAFELAQLLGDLLSDENWARVCYVGGES